MMSDWRFLEELKVLASRRRWPSFQGPRGRGGRPSPWVRRPESQQVANYDAAAVPSASEGHAALDGGVGGVAVRDAGVEHDEQHLFLGVVPDPLEGVAAGFGVVEDRASLHHGVPAPSPWAVVLGADSQVLLMAI